MDPSREGKKLHEMGGERSKYPRKASNQQQQKGKEGNGNEMYPWNIKLKMEVVPILLKMYKEEY